ncbi:MAG: MBL fold metallo-hydrolase [Bdellovibrionales bacterium]|nr:MBL fold metallo-hydrolase [Bdellovibrionales bacterium]
MALPLPLPFQGNEALGLVRENQPIAQFLVGDTRNLIYLILDWESRQAALVDNHPDLAEVTAALAKYGFSLKWILQTHTHWDHVGGLPSLFEEFPDARLLLHEKEIWRLQKSKDRALAMKAVDRSRCIRDQERLHLGQTDLLCHHVPGHSAGSISFEVSPPQGGSRFLLTGDTLFIQDCGRTDLETGSVAEMFASLQRYKTLDPSLIVLPGHQYRPPVAAVLESEWKTSPPFQVASVEELERLP